MAKVLLVEDDNNLREIYEMSLKAEGYETLSAVNGEEALEVASKHKPDLIISDVMMPKVSGFEMLAKLREDPSLKDTPVIMMTALSQSEDKVKADRLGVKKYLVKSQVTLEDLAKVAKELVPPSGAAPAAAITEPTASPDPTVSSNPVADLSVTTPPSEPAVTSSTPAEPTPSIAPAQEPATAPASAAEPSQQSSIEEQAAIEAQINAFVDTASTEANAKTVEATDTPVGGFAEPSQQNVVEAPITTETEDPGESTSKRNIQPLNDPTQGPDLHALAAVEEQKDNELKAAEALPTGSVIAVENPVVDAFSEAPVSPQLEVSIPPQTEATTPTSQVIAPETSAGGEKKVDPNIVAL